MTIYRFAEGESTQKEGGVASKRPPTCSNMHINNGGGKKKRRRQQMHGSEVVHLKQRKVDRALMG